MIAKIVVGLLGVAVLGVGVYVHHYQGGCCHTDEAVLTTKEACPCDTPAVPSCCQTPSRASLAASHSCCEQEPVCTTTKDGQQVLLIEPREVK